jgi:hypothetical protein
MPIVGTQTLPLCVVIDTYLRYYVHCAIGDIHEVLVFLITAEGFAPHSAAHQ